ncbi:cell division site-positioning protein MapZ family protein, partial [Streptococcus pneumoniae]|uniref:cell division site-positioning protein MapZ family protein n=1 Tax=Streptococcus pneumoniae TaxID=1313 RepID=UPI000AD4787B
NTELDKVLDKAISLGKSQQTSTSSSSSSQTSSSSSSQASSNTTSEPKPSSSNETRSSRSEVNMGLSSAGATSRSRGYITGDQYILERVNIVNGNGYYNL